MQNEHVSVQPRECSMLTSAGWFRDRTEDHRFFRIQGAHHFFYLNDHFEGQGHVGIQPVAVIAERLNDRR